jgi:hypothetical protein
VSEIGSSEYYLARIARERAADEQKPGSTLNCGDYIGVWEQGEHPYGQPNDCPFCKAEQGYTSFFYNGPGRPPSYAFQCGNCGAQGPTSHGGKTADQIGARIEAVELWSQR